MFTNSNSMTLGSMSNYINTSHIFTSNVLSVSALGKINVTKDNQHLHLKINENQIDVEIPLSERLNLLSGLLSVLKDDPEINPSMSEAIDNLIMLIRLS